MYNTYQISRECFYVTGISKIHAFVIKTFYIVKSATDFIIHIIYQGSVVWLQFEFDGSVSFSEVECMAQSIP